jgi:hypothetical protein
MITPINGILYNTPLRGINTFTKRISAEKTQKFFSKVLILGSYAGKCQYAGN